MPPALERLLRQAGRLERKRTVGRLACWRLNAGWRVLETARHCVVARLGRLEAPRRVGHQWDDRPVHILRQRLASVQKIPVLRIRRAQRRRLIAAVGIKGNIEARRRKIGRLPIGPLAVDTTRRIGHAPVHQHLVRHLHRVRVAPLYAHEAWRGHRLAARVDRLRRGALDRHGLRHAERVGEHNVIGAVA